MCNRLDSISACDRRTDGRTDRRTDILPRYSPRYAYSSRGKNERSTQRWNVEQRLPIPGVTVKQFWGERSKVIVIDGEKTTYPRLQISGDGTARIVTARSRSSFDRCCWPADKQLTSIHRSASTTEVSKRAVLWWISLNGAQQQMIGFGDHRIIEECHRCSVERTANTFNPGILNITSYNYAKIHARHAKTRNLTVANRSRVSCPHNTSRASPWP